MDAAFAKVKSLSNFVTNGIFVNLLRFIFERVFGAFFQNGINFQNIDLKNCIFKNLLLNNTKINDKFFKSTPFRLFAGSLQKFQIKLPNISNMLNESIEIELSGIDILLVFSDIEIKTQKSNNNMSNTNNNNDITHDMSEKIRNLENDLNIYKKIINRILLNMKIKIENICIRILSDKPYLDIRLPIAPCLMLKLKLLNIQKEYAGKGPENENLIFAKNQNYHISAYGLTAHMLSNYEVKPDEYIDKSYNKTQELPSFPFNYPNENHPSTFLVMACSKKKSVKKSDDNEDLIRLGSKSNIHEPFEIILNLSNEKSKTMEIIVPNIEIMVDFLKIKQLSRYVEKAMEYKKSLDYKEMLAQKATLKFPQKSPLNKPQNKDVSISKSSAPSSPVNSNSNSNNSNSNNNTPSNTSPRSPLYNKQFSILNRSIHFLGEDIDLEYFTQLSKKSINIVSPETDSDQEQLIDKNENKVEFIEDMNFNPIPESLINTIEQAPDISEELLDTSNIKIILKIRSIYTYVLKICPDFNQTEFKRRWIFGEQYHHSGAAHMKTFNNRIPFDHFQFKLCTLLVEIQKKNGHVEGKINLNNFKILDIIKSDSPSSYRNTFGYYHGHNNPTKDIYHISANSKSERFKSAKLASSIYMSTTNNYNKYMQANKNDSFSTNYLDKSLFQSTNENITYGFLADVRENKKEIIDWEIDPKRSHFCINVLFTFHRKPSIPIVRIKEDYTIYSSYVSTYLENPRDFKEEGCPNIQFEINNGNQLKANINLPPVYLNMYLDILEDFNCILHNASDMYLIYEKWYKTQNDYILNWLNQSSNINNQNLEQSSLFTSINTSHFINFQNQCLNQNEDNYSKINFFDEEQVNQELRQFYEKQPSMGIDITATISHIKIVLSQNDDIQTRKYNQELDTTFQNPFCFCKGNLNDQIGTQTDNLVIILELTRLITKLKQPQLPLMNTDDKSIIMLSHVLFEDLSLFYPSSSNATENEINFNKILSIKSKNIKGKKLNLASGTSIDQTILNSIILKQYKNNIKAQLSNIIDISNDIQTKSEENTKGLNKRLSLLINPKKPRKSSFNESSEIGFIKKKNKEETSKDTYRKEFKRFNNFTGPYKKTDYFKFMEDTATYDITTTMPLIDLYINDGFIKFMMKFTSKFEMQMNKMKQRLEEILIKEGEYFSKIINEINPNQPQIVNHNPDIFINLLINDLSLYVFPESTENNQTKINIINLDNNPILQVSNAPKHIERLNFSVEKLDQTVADFESMPYQYNPIKYPDLDLPKIGIFNRKLIFDKEKFYKEARKLLRLTLRNIHTSFLKSNEEGIQILHLKVISLFVIDKNQLKPKLTGSHAKSLIRDEEKQQNKARALSIELDDESHHNIIIYKPTSIDLTNKLMPLTSLKDYEYFKEYALSEAYYIFSNNYSIMTTQDSSVISLGILTYLKPEPDEPIKDIHLKFGNLILRSDFKLKTKDELIAMINKLPKKSDAEASNNSSTEQNKRSKGIILDNIESNNKGIIIDIIAEQLIIDIFPYLDYNYSNKFEKKYTGINAGDIDSQKVNELYYAQTRSLIMIEGINVKIQKNDEETIFQEITLSNLDVLLKNSKTNSILLFKNTEREFFDQNFEELKKEYGFVSNLLNISTFNLLFASEAYNTIDVNFKQISLNFHLDTIVAFEKHTHILLYSEYFLKDNATKEVKLSPNDSTEAKNVKPQKVKIDLSKPSLIGNHIELKEELNIDMNFFKSTENEILIADDDEFERLEEKQDSKPQIFSMNQNHQALNESVASSRMSTSSYITSTTAYRFDEENLHEFSVRDQEISYIYNTRVESFTLKIINALEFDCFDKNEEIKEIDLEKEITKNPKYKVLLDDRGSATREYIKFSVENFQLSCHMMTPNEKLSTNCSQRFALSIELCELIYGCPSGALLSTASRAYITQQKSIEQKLLCKKSNEKLIENLKNDPIALLEYKKENSCMINNFMDIIIEFYQHKKSKIKDLRIFLGLHPIKISFGMPQYHLITSIDRYFKAYNASFNSPPVDDSESIPANIYFQENIGIQPKNKLNDDFLDHENTYSTSDNISVMKCKNNEKKVGKDNKSEKTEYFIPLMHISKLEIKTNINLDLSIINFDLLKDFTLKFNSNTFRGVDNFDQLIRQLQEFYVPRIKKQIMSVNTVANLPLLRNVLNIASATFNVFYMPYSNFNKNKSIMQGLKRGTAGFVSSMASEGINLTEFVAGTLDRVIEISGIKKTVKKKLMKKYKT